MEDGHGGLEGVQRSGNLSRAVGAVDESEKRGLGR